MPGRQFLDAKIIYDALSRSGASPDEETISELSRILGLSSDKDALEERLSRLLRGLPSEDEFTAIALWMQNCVLIHKYDQSQFPEESRDRFRIPDLFVVFDHSGEEIKCLIEVKSSPDSHLLNGKLVFSERLYSGLSEYAKELDLPLLIAWKVGAYWLLFDIRMMKRKESAYHITAEEALRQDLMFMLVGNLVFSPMGGVRMVFVMEDLGPANENADDSERLARYSGLRFELRDGTDAESISWAQFLIWVLFYHVQGARPVDGKIELIYLVPEEAPSLQAYMMLPFLLFEIGPPDQVPTNWHDAIASNIMTKLPYDLLREEADAAVGKTIQYILKVIPHSIPDFIPENSPHRGQEFASLD